MDWATIAELGTAGGTLVLAIATFASVRSGNRSARLAEQTLQEGIRPLILPSRLNDPDIKVGFQDDHFMHIAGSHGAADATDDVVYFAISLRNVGAGLAILNAWQLHPGRTQTISQDRPDPSTFRRLTRDLYIAPNDTGFWQGAFRDRGDAQWDEVAAAVRGREAITIDILYGDAEGGQRMISRFTLLPTKDDTWLASVSRHWNLDRADPR